MLVEFGGSMAKKKAKKTEVEEISVDGQRETHHWSDDGTRHYGGFYETDNLATAKKECLAKFEKTGKTTLVLDRSAGNAEIYRHEADSKILKEEKKDVRKSKTKR